MAWNRLTIRNQTPPRGAGLRARPKRLGLSFGGSERSVSPQKLLGAGAINDLCPRSSVADQGLAAAGLGAAVVAASFAGYMIVRESGPAGVEIAEPKILAALNPPDATRDSGRARRGAGPFDFDATGSIDRGREEIADGVAGDVQPALKTRGAPPSPAGGGTGYVLRFVHKGVAIVQVNGRSYVVAPGANLPQAGRVHSIEKRAGRWVVVTAAGLIVEAP
jgi:hypothetical protein